MHLAMRYKVISKLLFFASLMVAWAMVLVGVAKVLPPPPHAAFPSDAFPSVYGGGNPASSK